MIRRSMARSLLERFTEHLDYNINIMDEDGIIIASTDPTRIDSFHEAAFNIIHGKEDVEIIYPGDSLPSGVKPGINLPIIYQQKVLGVIGVTGHPDEIKSLAYSVKTAVETMLEYELYKEKILRRQDKKNLLLSMLIYEENMEIAKIKNLASQLGYRDDLLRIPLILRFSGNVDLNTFIPIIKNTHFHAQQDMTFVTADYNLLIFKILDGFEPMKLSNSKFIVTEYIEGLRNALKQKGYHPSFSCFSGSIQQDFDLFRASYQHAQWLMNYYSGSFEGVHFFSDHIPTFLQSRIPFKDFSNIFTVYEKRQNFILNDKIMDTVEALFRCNMSIIETAKELGIHRNTVYARLDKIKELIGIDPLQSIEDRDFMYSFLAFYQQH